MVSNIGRGNSYNINPIISANTGATIVDMADITDIDARYWY